jgi:transposase
MARRATYTSQPAVPAAVLQRYRIMLAVIAGSLSVSEGARQLKLSRPRFHSLLHRGLTGFVTAIEPQRPGRPSRAATEKALTQANARLRRENARLAARVQQTRRLLEIAAASLPRRATATRSRTRPTAKRRAAAPATSDEPGPAHRLATVQSLRRHGLTVMLAAAVVGISARTVRRWQGRARRSEPLRRAHRIGPRAPVSHERATVVRHLVRELHGLIGAEALRQSVPGISRREAAAVKRATLIELEKERRQRATRIVVTQPGVLRGVDGLHITTTDRPRHVLVVADGSIPYRTGVYMSARYDGAAVATLLARDFLTHGPPLVCRLDRAKAHGVGAVHEVLTAHRVLVLHGPAHYPAFYGQLERQNREHRQWLEWLGRCTPAALGVASEFMLDVLNGRWRRRSLAWATAEELWQQRRPLDVDRAELADEVRERSQRLVAELAGHGDVTILATRLAIEQALINRGLLRRVLGGWC